MTDSVDDEVDTTPPPTTGLPLPDDPDLGHDQPQGPDTDESTIQDFQERYGKKS